MKDFLNKLLKERKAELEEKTKRMKESSDIKEVREIGETLIKLRDEINDIEKQLAELKEEEEKEKEETEETEEQSERQLNPIATYKMEKMDKREELKGRDSMEYRTAFKDYIQKGTINPVLEMRTDGPATSGDLGVLLPNTVMEEIIKETDKKYGQLYSRVRHLNIPGGIDFPIGSFDFTAKRILEGATAPTAEKGQITNKISFGLKHCWIGASKTILESQLNVGSFEKELINGISNGFLKKMSSEIINGQGSASNEMEGILFESAKTDSRIKADHIIEFTASEIADWKKWQTKLFAKIPLEVRGENPEFIMTPATYESNIKTLADNNNRPVYYETFNPTDGVEISRFKGREVVFINDGLGLVDFDNGANGDVFGLYWVPQKAYAINSNMQFSMTTYRDHTKLMDVIYALVVNDGKVLDPNYIYILKKKV